MYELLMMVIFIVLYLYITLVFLFIKVIDFSLIFKHISIIIIMNNTLFQREGSTRGELWVVRTFNLLINTP